MIILPSFCKAEVPSQAAKALLNGDWQGVYFGLREDDTVAEDPVNRFLMGHACIAINRNNEAFRLFQTVHDRNDKNSWLAWTKACNTKNDNQYSKYVYADALTRVGSYKDAENLYEKIIKYDESFSLAYNARGILRINQGRLNEAYPDFLLANEKNMDLADVYLNLGNYCVLLEANMKINNMDQPKGILYYNKAIELNPEFSLAYNGRGCMLYGCGLYEQAMDDFIRAYTIMPELQAARLNESFSMVAISEICSLYKAIDSGICEKPGMSITIRKNRHNVHKEILEKQKSEIESRKQNLPKLPENWEQSLESAKPRNTGNSSNLDQRAIQNEVIGKITNLEMQIANARYEMEQSTKGLDFATRLNNKLEMISLVNKMRKGAFGVYKAIQKDELDLYLGEKVTKDIAKKTVLDSISNESTKMAAKMTFSLIFKDPVEYALAPAKQFTGKEVQENLAQNIQSKSIEISNLAEKYSRQMEHLRRSGIEVYRHHHEITVNNGVDTWKYRAGSDIASPEIRLQTRLDRPFWDIAALAGHLKDLSKSPIDNYSRTETKSTSMRITSKPWKPTMIISDSPAAQKISSLQMGIRGQSFGVVDAPTPVKINQLLRTYNSSIVKVDNSKYITGPAIEINSYQNQDSRTLNLVNHCKQAANTTNIPQLPEYNGSSKIAQPGDIVIRTGGIGTIPHTYTYFGNQRINDLHFDSIELVKTEQTNQSYIVAKHWTADSGPGQNFYRPLESTKIKCNYQGRETTLADLPDNLKSKIIQRCFELQVKELGNNKGDYLLPGVNSKSNQCSDFTLRSYSKAFSESKVSFNKSDGKKTDFAGIFTSQINIGPIKLESSNPMSSTTTKVAAPAIIETIGKALHIPIRTKNEKAMQESMPQVAAPYYGIKDSDLHYNQPKMTRMFDVTSTSGGYNLNSSKIDTSTKFLMPDPPNIKINKPNIPYQRRDVPPDDRKYPPITDWPDGGSGGVAINARRNGGGAGTSINTEPVRSMTGLPNREMKIPTFTPLPPRNSSKPGGIKMDNLAKSVVDRGNWPVLPLFTYTLDNTEANINGE